MKFRTRLIGLIGAVLPTCYPIFEVASGAGNNERGVTTSPPTNSPTVPAGEPRREATCRTTPSAGQASMSHEDCAFIDTGTAKQHGTAGPFGCHPAVAYVPARCRYSFRCARPQAITRHRDATPTRVARLSIFLGRTGHCCGGSRGKNRFRHRRAGSTLAAPQAGARRGRAGERCGSWAEQHERQAAA